MNKEMQSNWFMSLIYVAGANDPVSILEETVELFENRFGEKGLTLRMTLPTDFSRFLLGDPDRLQQLFTNLLENCLRYNDVSGISLWIVSTRISESSVIEQLTAILKSFVKRLLLSRQIWR